ncbi:M14 family metallopeptidase [Actinophytocola oryzae]|uniref:Zinc carboxypeptidase n=1 Tax=Actinophytocola oryzae TaxID=502181 RepID=A0A4R7VBE4_9PSEU|nr:M14 family metallopeptidase [Actinophytocola oryzae]TDV46248.1 carboxypeptidase T [Actinophytocola oryzae]
MLGKRRGLVVAAGVVAAVALAGSPAQARTAPEQGVADFPSGDEGYHTYDELRAALRAAVSAHPGITSLSSIGDTYEGREIPVIRISDNAATDEDEPEVLFTCNLHAREHLTTEMCLHIVDRFTAGYGSDEKITGFVDSREILVVPSLNPDGAEYDISGGWYRGWRKNRQPNAGGSVGTDLNRNFSYKWACCQGASTSPSAETYRGPSAASAPEVRALQAYVDSRVVGGVQQIRAHIDFHAFSEMVLWPFGHTHDTATEGMTQAEYDHLKSIGQEMATSNGYTPGQTSDMYITDGDINDWMWGTHKVLTYCFEMYPTSGGSDGFYPPDEQIVPQTTRNDGAVDILLANAT